MSPPFKLTPQAAEDMDGIWWFIAEHNQEAADRVEAEIVAACRLLANGDPPTQYHAPAGALFGL